MLIQRWFNFVCLVGMFHTSQILLRTAGSSFLFPAHCLSQQFSRLFFDTFYGELRCGLYVPYLSKLYICIYTIVSRMNSIQKYCTACQCWSIRWNDLYSIQRLSILRKHLVIGQVKLLCFLWLRYPRPRLRSHTRYTINQQTSYDSGILHQHYGIMRQDYGIIRGFPNGRPSV